MMSTPVEERKTVGGFWESRIGWNGLKHTLLLEPLPGGSRWAAAFGSLLLFTFLLQAITGILLAMSYAPAVKTAWPSVKFIQEQLPLGWYIRAVHHWGASVMIILALFHLIQVYVWGAYKRPRELTWMVGVLLLMCLIGLAFTGYLLPWDEKAYWATRVGLGIVGTVPWVGDSLRAILQGGPDLGNLTLTRFFTWHGFILPVCLCLLAVVHVYLFRLQGVTPPWWRSPEQLEAQAEPFWPGQVLKDALLALLLLVGLGVWCLYYPAPLGAEADPAKPFEARPEWYFMFLFRLLRYFEGPYEVVGTFVLPTVFCVALFLWPLLDRNPRRDPRRRPLAIALLLLATAGLLGSTIYAIATDVQLPEPTMAAALERGALPPAGPIQTLQIVHIYRDSCSACHGEDGGGSPVRAAMPAIPDFRSMAWQTAKTDLEIVHQIQDGKEPVMPPFRGKLSQQQILGLAIYLRAFAVSTAAETHLPGAEKPLPAVPPKPTTPETPQVAVPSPSKTPPLTKEAPPPAAVKQAPALATMKESLPPSHQPPILSPSGSQLFRDFCMACHGADGHGAPVRAAMPEIPDFTNRKWQSSRSDAELKHSILEGKGKFMLPMKSKVGTLGAEKLEAYVRDFAHGQPVAPVAKPVPEPAPKPIAKPVSEPAPKVEHAKVPPKEPLLPRPPQKPTPPVAGPEISGMSPPSETTERVHFAATAFREYCLTCHGADGHGTDMRVSMPAIPDFTNSDWQRNHNDAQLAASVQNGKGGLMPAFGDKLMANQIRDLVTYVRAFGPSVPRPTRVEANDLERQFHQLQEQWNQLERQIKELPPEQSKP
jgi:ubiquinol-cytochrome c reductase cytochrome b subunit